MKNLVAVLALVLASACGMASVNARLDTLERENLALRRQNVQLRQGQGTKAAPAPAATTVPAAAPMAGPRPAAGIIVNRAWVRAQHGAYLCFVNNDPHLGQGDRIEFVNDIADNYGMTTTNNTVANKWVSIRLNGEPVLMLRPTMSGYVVGYHLGPDEHCTAALGGATHLTIVSELYKNKGSARLPQLLETGYKNRREVRVDPMRDLYEVHFDRFTF